MDTSVTVMLNNNRPESFVRDKRREMILQIFQVKREQGKYDILANELGLISKCIDRFFSCQEGVLIKFYGKEVSFAVPPHAEAYFQSLEYLQRP